MHYLQRLHNCSKNRNGAHAPAVIIDGFDSNSVINYRDLVLRGAISGYTDKNLHFLLLIEKTVFEIEQRLPSLWLVPDLVNVYQV